MIKNNFELLVFRVISLAPPKSHNFFLISDFPLHSDALGWICQKNFNRQEKLMYTHKPPSHSLTKLVLCIYPLFPNSSTLIFIDFIPTPAFQPGLANDGRCVRPFRPRLSRVAISFDAYRDYFVFPLLYTVPFSTRRSDFFFLFLELPTSRLAVDISFLSTFLFCFFLFLIRSFLILSVVVLFFFFVFFFFEFVGIFFWRFVLFSASRRCIIEDHLCSFPIWYLCVCIGVRKKIFLAKIRFGLYT